jgi:quinol monooxygenase YgiN
MFVVTVTFRVKLAQRDAFHAAVKRQAGNSLEKETDCRQFEVLVDPSDSTLVFLYEVYTNRSAFDAHCNSEHFREFAKLVADWIDEKHVACWQPLEIR